MHFEFAWGLKLELCNVKQIVGLSVLSGELFKVHILIVHSVLFFSSLSLAFFVSLLLSLHDQNQENRR
jgi:hypothetical protein